MHLKDKSGGVDGIQKKILKYVALYIIEPIKYFLIPLKTLIDQIVSRPRT